MCRELLKICPLLHAKTSLSVNYSPFLATFIKVPILFAVAGEDYKDLEEAGAVPCDISVLSVGVFQTLLSKVLSACLTTVFTCMPKISQAHNHWVWKLSGRKGLAQCHQCTPIFYWLCWKLWSHEKQFVSQHNFSLEFQIRGVCLAFSTTFIWKNLFFCSYPQSVCCFMPSSPFWKVCFFLTIEIL